MVRVPRRNRRPARKLKRKAPGAKYRRYAKRVKALGVYNTGKGFSSSNRIVAAAGKLTESKCYVRTWMRSLPGTAAAIKRVGAPNYYLLTKSENLACVQGKQNATAFCNLSLSDLEDIRSYITATTQVPIRYVLQSVQSEYTFANTGTNPIMLELYDVNVKKDILDAWVYQYPPSSPGFTVFPTPDSYWGVGLQTQSGGTINYDQLASTPFDSQLFKTFFTVSKRTTITMPMGATHRHTVNQTPNCVINDAMIAQENQVEALAGLSSYVLWVVQGFPSVDNSNQPSITTQHAQVTAVSSRRFKYTFSQDISTNLFNNNGLAGQTNPPKNINIGSGVVESQSTLL